MAKSSEKSVTVEDLAVISRIRARRQELGWSQENLAEMLGLSFQQIHKYESGKNRITVGLLVRMAKALQVPVGYFFSDSSSTSRPAEGLQKYVGELAAVEGAVRLLECFAIMPESTRKALLVIAEGLAIKSRK